MRNSDAVKIEGFSDWVELSGALIHGLSHAFTNRIASLASYADLMSYGEKEFAAEVFLPKEIGKLQSLNQAMRLLVPREEAPSAVELAPLIREAFTLYSHHGKAYAQESELVITGQELPVRIVPSDLIHLILLLVDQSSASHREDGETKVVFALNCEDMAVTLVCRGAQTITPYMEAVASECGAALAHTVDGVAMKLPTLLALRAR